MMDKISMLLLITIILETSHYHIKASKENIASESSLKEEMVNYLMEVHYPDSEDINVIEQDLKATLELDECIVTKRAN